MANVPKNRIEKSHVSKSFTAAGYAQRVMSEVNRALKGTPSSLQNDLRLKNTLKEIGALDRLFAQRRGLFFHVVGDSFRTAKHFTQIHVEEYRKIGRPSLPALAIHHAELLGLDKKSAAYKAMIFVAVRAEMKTAVMPDYHSKFHYADVVAVTAGLLKKNNEMGAMLLTKQEQALALIAAIGHDLDHPGCGNPKNDPLFNEQTSFDLMRPLLKDAGLPDADIEKIHTILMTTSPDGPHAALKAVARAQREGHPADFSMIDPQNRFPGLAVLSDERLAQMAAIVSDADLYASGGAGLKSNLKMSELMTSETRKAGGSIDFTSDAARKFFLDNIIGKEGYASIAGRAVANPAFEALRAETGQRLATAHNPLFRKL